MKKRVIIVFCFFFLTMFLIIYAFHSSASITKPVNEMENIIRDYITYLSEAGDYTKTKGGKMVSIELYGIATESSALPTISLDEAEKSGLIGEKNHQNSNSMSRIEQYTAVARQQHDFVIAQFGPDAWKDVSYTLVEMDPVDGILGYRIVSTKELISENEYNDLLQQYWKDIAEKEGITYNDIFLVEGESVEKLENKRMDIITKYTSEIPVELTLISDTQTYMIKLSFNGKLISDQKFEDFHFIIDNRNGDWTVFQGLSWTAPYSDFPEGD